MNTICPKENCTGCTACANICNHGAIQMLEDECGFRHPTIDSEKCVDCGLCVKTCPVNAPLRLNMPTTCYAATTNDDNELMSCSSGGVATVLSRHIIEKGGVVYGCSGKDVSHFCHIRVDNIDEVEQLKGSKYIQSDMGTVMSDIKTDLKNEKLVFFVGTPCQVAGLHNYLHKDYPNLYTADLVCHGVPSQKMFNENLRRYTDTPDDAIVTFRRKAKIKDKTRIEFGWNYTSKRTGRNIFHPYNKDFYMFGFLRCLTFRENCYTCPYARNERVGDITLCDFWGLQADAGFDNGKGVSAALINTERGSTLFHCIKERINYKERTVSEATRWNDQLNRPSVKPENYADFIKSYGSANLRYSMTRTYFADYLHDCYTNTKNTIKRLLLSHLL